MIAALAQALLAEREERWLDSFRFCQAALEEAPDYPAALSLLGRLSAQAQDGAAAIALQRYALALDPSLPQAPGYLAQAMKFVQSAPMARERYDEACRVAPVIAAHHVLPGTLLPFARMGEVELLLREAIRLDPSFARAQASLANVLVRKKDLQGAVSAYKYAVMLDWDFAGAHLAYAALLEALRDYASCDRHYREAFARERFYSSALPAPATRVLLLKAPARAIANATLDFVLNPWRTAIDVAYVGAADDRLPELDGYDAVINGVGEYESSAHVLERVERMLAGKRSRVVNAPAAVARVGRSRLHETLAGIEGCFVPKTVRLDAADAPAYFAAQPQRAYPFTVRPVDTDRGEGLEIARNAAQAQSYLARTDAASYVMRAFIDYGSADGYFRKYRIVVVDGEPYPYHLAISDSWLVHYIGSLMEQHAWMREEEERFLREPRRVFTRWGSVFAEIARATGLDYFSLDCAVMADGTVLVFEAGPNMLVHCLDDPEVFHYKYAHVPRIFDAVEDALTKHA